LSKAAVLTRGGGSTIKEQLEPSAAIKGKEGFLEAVAPKSRSVSQR
jgi:hypothetical protein